MKEMELRGLIEEVAMEVGSENEFAWDGGQDGHYYFNNSSSMSKEEFENKRIKLDKLSEKVSVFLIENDMSEEDLWN